jgi:hypothetical protein
MIHYVLRRIILHQRSLDMTTVCRSITNGQVLRSSPPRVLLLVSITLVLESQRVLFNLSTA